jgi:hypothetical protein
MRREPDELDPDDAALVYAARKVRHARRVEALLTAAGVDYVVETDVISVGMLFRSQRVGAFFYVASVDETRAREVLAREGFELKVG